MKDKNVQTRRRENAPIDNADTRSSPFLLPRRKIWGKKEVFMTLSYIRTKPLFLRSRKQGRHAQPKKLKNLTKSERTALRVYGFRCHYCNERVFETFDHIVPKVNGGKDNAENLVPCCKSCNSSKQAMSYDEFKYIMAVERISLNASLQGDF